MMSALVSGLKALGLETQGPRVQRLEAYLQEIDLWNPRYGLTAPGEDVVGRHILDSLSGLASIQELQPKRLADVGSGAGFPGIPLAIWLEETQIHLIERSGRRAGFLENAVLALGLKNVTVHECAVEKVRQDEAGFDVVTFRAWSAVDASLVKLLAPLLAPGGCIAAYKGRRDVAEAEIHAAGDTIESSRLVPLNVPGNKDPRHMAFLTPKK